MAKPPHGLKERVAELIAEDLEMLRAEKEKWPQATDTDFLNMLEVYAGKAHIWLLREKYGRKD